jgi:phosphomannomutase
VLQVVVELHKQGKTFSSLLDSIIAYANSGELNFKLEHKDEAVAALYQRYAVEQEPTKMYDIDGYRIEFEDWWFNVRKSNTEPIIRIYSEAPTEEEANGLAQQIIQVIQEIAAN